jgi:hypothetical protein
VLAEDMLVQVFSRPELQEEPPWHHAVDRRRRLGDDGGMDAHDRTRHSGTNTDPLRRFRDTSQH